MRAWERKTEWAGRRARERRHTYFFVVFLQKCYKLYSTIKTISFLYRIIMYMCDLLYACIAEYFMLCMSNKRKPTERAFFSFIPSTILNFAIVCGETTVSMAMHIMMRKIHIISRILNIWKSVFIFFFCGCCCCCCCCSLFERFLLQL